ncbi:hypothetical protein ACFQZT_05225 [Paenibacillus sp. GCM10027628]
MKKWLFGLIILFLLGYGVAQHKLNVVNEKPPEDEEVVKNTTVV